MTIEDQAKIIRTKMGLIKELADMIDTYAKLILFKHRIDPDTFELSKADKQKIIGHYNTVKTELENVVNSLP